MAKNLVAQVARPGGAFELVEREIPEPGPGEVRIKALWGGISRGTERLVFSFLMG